MRLQILIKYRGVKKGRVTAEKWNSGERGKVKRKVDRGRLRGKGRN